MLDSRNEMQQQPKPDNIVLQLQLQLHIDRHLEFIKLCKVHIFRLFS